MIAKVIIQIVLVSVMVLMRLMNVVFAVDLDLPQEDATVQVTFSAVTVYAVVEKLLIFVVSVTVLVYKLT